MCWSSKQNSLSEFFSHVNFFFSCGFICWRREFSLQGLQRMNKLRCWGQLHSFQEIQSSNNWIPVIVWSLIRQRLHQKTERQKDVSAAAALIEPLTNPRISQQNEQSQWWFGLILVLVVHLGIWHGSSPKVTEIFHCERREDETLNSQYLMSKISFYPSCILKITLKNA